MINFRFHIASLIAVFLALAVGVVMGSTVIDRAIVDSLRNQIQRVEQKADDRKAENDELRDEVSRLENYVAGTQQFAVTGRLRDRSVVVLAVDGTDGDSVKKTVELAQQAGGRVPGILWIQEPWSLAKDEDSQKLARVLDVAVGKDKSLREAGWKALSQRLLSGSADTVAAVDTTTAQPPADLLVALRDAEFLRYEPVGKQPDDFALTRYPGAGARVLVVDGEGGNVDAADVILPATRALAVAGVPTEAAEVYSGDTKRDRGSIVAPVRDDDQLQQLVSTVDDLELPEGRVTAVLALSDLGRSVVGHYGYGAGATRSLPEWSQL